MAITIYKAILHTSGKTREQIEQKFEVGPPPSEKEIANLTEYYNLLDGAAVFVTKYQDEYALIAWPEEENDRIKESFWLAEQDPMMGTYENREDFDADFDSVRYVPDCSIVFEAADIEIVEELKTNAEEATRKCRVCGCTDYCACPGGCYWVEEDLCSRCAADRAAAEEDELIEIGRKIAHKQPEELGDANDN